jgi:uncharacterized membrane protein
MMNPSVTFLGRWMPIMRKILLSTFLLAAAMAQTVFVHPVHANPYFFSVQADGGRGDRGRRGGPPPQGAPRQAPAQFMPPPQQPSGQRMTPEQRQELRRQVREANREVYPQGQGRGRRN